jgi:hypothetical protein
MHKKKIQETQDRSVPDVFLLLLLSLSLLAQFVACIDEGLAQQVTAMPGRLGRTFGRRHIHANGPDGIASCRLVQLTVARAKENMTHLGRRLKLVHIRSCDDTKTGLFPARLVKPLNLCIGGRNGRNEQEHTS